MDSDENLFELGKIALEKQSSYLKLKIEKELAGKGPFAKEEELQKASAEWQLTSAEYRTLFDSLPPENPKEISGQ